MEQLGWMRIKMIVTITEMSRNGTGVSRENYKHD